MFKSSLADEIAAFLDVRYMCVSEYSVSSDRRALTSLDKHLVENEFFEKILTEELLDSWMLTLTGKSKTVQGKVGVVKIFVKYLNSLGNSSFSPTSPRVKSDYIPYIYSDDELFRIMYYADNLTSKKPHVCSAFIYIKIPMFIRILYGCGSRVGETVALQRKDIDFKRKTIFFHNTKFAKERLIPAHESLISILRYYCLTIGIMNKPDAYLFPGRKPNSHFVRRQMQTWFSKILSLSQIDQRDKSYGERGASLHCLRHLFVLKSMQQLEACGHPVDMNDLLLPTYLGHECLLDTDKYMRFSGVQVPESLDAFERFADGLIPKVEVTYEEE